MDPEFISCIFFILIFSIIFRNHYVFAHHLRPFIVHLSLFEYNRFHYRQILNNVHLFHKEIHKHCASHSRVNIPRCDFQIVIKHFFASFCAPFFQSWYSYMCIVCVRMRRSPLLRRRCHSAKVRGVQTGTPIIPIPICDFKTIWNFSKFIAPYFWSELRKLFIDLGTGPQLKHAFRNGKIGVPV